MATLLATLAVGTWTSLRFCGCAGCPQRCAPVAAHGLAIALMAVQALIVHCMLQAPALDAAA